MAFLALTIIRSAYQFLNNTLSVQWVESSYQPENTSPIVFVRLAACATSLIFRFRATTRFAVLSYQCVPSPMGKRISFQVMPVFTPTYWFSGYLRYNSM